MFLRACHRFHSQAVSKTYARLTSHVAMPSKKQLGNFTFTHAIVKEPASTFADHCIKMDSGKQVELSRSIKQFAKYLDALKSCGLMVETLPADEKYPDSVFIEDTAFVIGNKACMTKPGHPSRKGEVESVRQALRAHGLEICELDDPSAIVDGGDILFTGQEILVGESSRSNKAAVDSLQRVFPDFPVVQIPVSGPLHLKSVATLAQDGVILISQSDAAKLVLKHIQEKATGKYKFLFVENDVASNVIFINNCTLIKPEREIGSADFKTLTSGLTVPWIEIEFDEFYKADGCLSCCCLLINKNGTP